MAEAKLPPALEQVHEGWLALAPSAQLVTTLNPGFHTFHSFHSSSQPKSSRASKSKSSQPGSFGDTQWAARYLREHHVAISSEKSIPSPWCLCRLYKQLKNQIIGGGYLKNIRQIVSFLQLEVRGRNRTKIVESCWNHLTKNHLFIQNTGVFASKQWGNVDRSYMKTWKHPNTTTGEPWGSPRCKKSGQWNQSSIFIRHLSPRSVKV